MVTRETETETMRHIDKDNEAQRHRQETMRHRDRDNEA